MILFGDTADSWNDKNRARGADKRFVSEKVAQFINYSFFLSREVQLIIKSEFN